MGNRGCFHGDCVSILLNFPQALTTTGGGDKVRIMRKGNWKWVSILLAAMVVQPAVMAQRPPRTDPGAYVPGPNMPMPHYFTGTYNWVHGYVKPLPPPNPTDPPTQLEWIKLHVNGQQVKEIQRDPNAIHLAMQISAVVDSTHFAHGSTLTVTVTAMDEHDRFYIDSDSAPITNVFRSYQHQDAGVNTPVQTMLALAIPGYSYFTRIGSGWSLADVMSAHSETSAAFFATHGATSLVQAGSGELISQSDMLLARTLSHGSGLSPFNSGGPRTSLVVTLSCTTGINNNWYEPWFWPYEDAYGEWVKNQAGHGYSGSLFWDKMDKHSEELWTWLKAGKTIFRAREELILQELARIEDGQPPLYPVGGRDIPFTHATQGPIWGDWYTTLRGVYTGNNFTTLAWHR